MGGVLGGGGARSLMPVGLDSAVGSPSLVISPRKRGGKKTEQRWVSEGEKGG